MGSEPDGEVWGKNNNKQRVLSKKRARESDFRVTKSKRKSGSGEREGEREGGRERGRGRERERERESLKLKDHSQ